MELGGATAEELGERSVIVSPGGRDLVLGEQHVVVDRRRQVVEDVHPQVALVLDGVVDDDGRGRLRLTGHVGFQRGSDAGRVPVPALGEMNEQLDVGVRSDLDPTDQLGDEALVDDDRRVRLFDAEQMDRSASPTADARRGRRGTPSSRPEPCSNVRLRTVASTIVAAPPASVIASISSAPSSRRAITVPAWRFSTVDAVSASTRSIGTAYR